MQKPSIATCSIYQLTCTLRGKPYTIFREGASQLAEYIQEMFDDHGPLFVVNSIRAVSIAEQIKYRRAIKRSVRADLKHCIKWMDGTYYGETGAVGDKADPWEAASRFSLSTGCTGQSAQQFFSRLSMHSYDRLQIRQRNVIDWRARLNWTDATIAERLRYGRRVWSPSKPTLP